MLKIKTFRKKVLKQPINTDFLKAFLNTNGLNPPEQSSSRIVLKKNNRKEPSGSAR